MHSSSDAVKPELFGNDKRKIKLDFIYTAKNIIIEEDHIKIETNINSFYLMIYKNGIVRFTTYNKEIDLESSYSIETLEPVYQYKLINDDNISKVVYNHLIIEIQHTPFHISIFKNGKLKYQQKAVAFCDTQSYLFIERSSEAFIYGLGEKTGFLNKNNEKTVMWNSDVFEPHTQSNKELYQSINMFSYIINDQKYGLFLDNPSRVTFDFETNDHESVIISDIGKLDYYIYTGDTLKEIIIQNADLTGRSYLPPLWALGYHQSRHSYESVEELLEIYHNFKQRKIPVDAIYLDILYMDHYKVFTFNEKTYNGVESVLKELKEDGVEIVPIVDPGVKVEEGYSVYDEGVKQNLFCKYPGGKLFTGHVWPGESAFYDFTNERIRKIWGENHKVYTDLGIEGIWNDMNEPSVFYSEGNTMDLSVLHQISDSQVKSHREMHNIYGLGMSMATYEGLQTLTNKRPFVLTRAGYAGIQKYATVWTGDNRSSWEHLEMSMPMCLNLGLSGVSLCGIDVGGFMDNATEELLIRWTQMGVFLPFFRNHCSIGMRRQEPWTFSKRGEKITRKFIRLRYELIRFLYSEVYKSHKDGVPMMKPLVLKYEDDPKTYSIHDQFIIGDNVMVAPIVRPGETARKVYLPTGIWFNFFTNEKYKGNQFIIADATLDQIPVFVKAESIIPLTDWCMNTEKLSNKIKINVYSNGNDFKDSFVIDDGRSLTGKYKQVEVNYHNKEVEVKETGSYEVNFEYEINIIK